MFFCILFLLLMHFISLQRCEDQTTKRNTELSKYSLGKPRARSIASDNFINNAHISIRKTHTKNTLDTRTTKSYLAYVSQMILSCDSNWGLRASWSVQCDIFVIHNIRILCIIFDFVPRKPNQPKSDSLLNLFIK